MKDFSHKIPVSSTTVPDGQIWHFLSVCFLMPFYLKLYVYRTLIPLKLGHSEMPSQSPENTDNAYQIETIGYLSVVLLLCEVF